MKMIHKTGFLLCVSMTVLLWTCVKADKEYIHDSNTISQMICKASHGSSEFRGVIYEYDKNLNPITGEFTQQDVEGGSGLIIFEIPESLKNDVDLTNIYLVATLTWDQVITPSLTGRHDITGNEGVIFTVKSGVGAKRQYRVKGSYR